MQTNAAAMSNRAMPNIPLAADASPLPPAESQQVARPAPPAQGTSNRITLSFGGRTLSKSADGDSDAVVGAIKKSKYPDQVKDLMLKIRELQAELRKKAAELSEVAADQTLTPRQRELKTAALREAVSGITSALRTAMSTLNETMTELDFSSEDKRAIGVLLSGA